MNYQTPHSASYPAPEFLLEWGVRGSRPGEFDFPIDLVINRCDEIFVTDFYNARVQKFSPSGELLALFDVAPNPGGMALDRAGNLYISHFSVMRLDEIKKPDKITVWSSTGELLREWGSTGTGPGEFDYPGGIAVDQNERIYVADQTNHRMQVFDSQGRFLDQWGEYGVAPGQFGGNTVPHSRAGGPQFVAIDSIGHVYTTEGSVGRIQKFTSEGEFLSAWGDNDIGPGSFGGGWQTGLNSGLFGPICIYIDARDSIWVSAACGRIQQFSNEGEYLRGIGEKPGNGPGQFTAPHGLATDSRGDLYVVDSYNHRIQKFNVSS